MVKTIEHLTRQVDALTQVMTRILLRWLHRLQRQPPLRLGDFDKFSNLHFSKNHDMLTDILKIIEIYYQTEEILRRAVELYLLFDSHFSIPDASTNLRTGNQRKIFPYLLLDPRITFTLIG